MAQAPNSEVADVEMLQSLAAVSAMFGRTERAISLLHLALWIAPRNAETIRLMAVFYYNDGRHEQTATLIRLFEMTGTPLPEDLALIKLRHTN
ncbi:MAG: hypothetical protein ABJM43_19820 [Paracoccaceae bacterium]